MVSGIYGSLCITSLWFNPVEFNPLATVGSDRALTVYTVCIHLWED